MSLLSIYSHAGEDSDMVTNMRIKERVLFKKLDASIRHHLRKQGISLSYTTYTGFDTEFKNVAMEENVLVSAQIAVSTRAYFKIPTNPLYLLSNLDGSVNKLLKQSKSSSIFNYTKVENSIALCVKAIRQIKYGNYDESMVKLTESLKSIRGINFYESEEYTLFALPRSMIQPYIQVGSCVSLSELAKISSSITRGYKKDIDKKLIHLIREICSSNFTIHQGKEKLQAEILEKFGETTTISELSSYSDKLLPHLTQEDEGIIKNHKPEKPLTRVYLQDLFAPGTKVSLTTTNQYYFLAHLTQADLSMLSDFDDVKEQLSIVNGSFVTLRDPLICSGMKIHIRDTMLLAPAGGKSLEKIGRLYGSAFNKISISRAQLEDMQSFLAVNREKFIEYALRDALISLIHSL